MTEASPVTILHSCVLDALPTLPEKSVHMVATSPPYMSLRHYPIPDTDGVELRDQPVVPGGNAMAFSTIPVGGIKTALEEAGLPVVLSEDAGRYLCNAVFFWTAATQPVPVGSLRVPADPGGVETVMRALEIAFQVTAKRLAAQRVEATA